jgi:hypothetical protein
MLASQPIQRRIRVFNSSYTPTSPGTERRSNGVYVHVGRGRYQIVPSVEYPKAKVAGRLAMPTF